MDTHLARLLTDRNSSYVQRSKGRWPKLSCRDCLVFEASFTRCTSERERFERSTGLIGIRGFFLGLDGMAFWPADSRENVPVASKRSRKEVKQARWEFPFVTEGSSTATTLVNKDGKFQWTHVLQDKGRSAQIYWKTHR